MPRARFIKKFFSQCMGIHVKREQLPSIAYSEELIFSMSASLQSPDRHYGLVGQA
jgi:hypothetical protein